MPPSRNYEKYAYFVSFWAKLPGSTEWTPYSGVVRREAKILDEHELNMLRAEANLLGPNVLGSKIEIVSIVPLPI